MEQAQLKTILKGIETFKYFDLRFGYQKIMKSSIILT